MKNNTILFSVIALFAITFAISAVAAADFVNVNDVEVEINDINTGSGPTVTGVTVAGTVSNAVPVEVRFKATENVDDVRVKVYLEGFKEDIVESTDRFHVVNGSSYVKRFTLELPSTMDLDELTEKVTFVVRITAKGEEPMEFERIVSLERELYSLSILSIDAPETVSAGSVFATDVVVENNGNKRLNNVYLRVSIPELGVERKVYAGDLSEKENSDYENDYLDITDTESRRVYITLPRNAAPGTYNLEVEAYNYDTSTTAKKKIVVSGSQVGILPSVTSKTIAKGEETTLDVVLVNPNDRLVVFSLMPEQAKGLIIEVTEPVVAVSADSSRTVKVRVKATESAEEGTHLVTVNVASEDGATKQVSFTVNVEGTGTRAITQRSDVVLILTVVLAIIFVVLLVILIVLLTRRPAESEELGETSYY